jgi:hypothetical protein
MVFAFVSALNPELPKHRCFDSYFSTGEPLSDGSAIWSIESVKLRKAIVGYQYQTVAGSRYFGGRSETPEWFIEALYGPFKTSAMRKTVVRGVRVGTLLKPTRTLPNGAVALPCVAVPVPSREP